MADDIDIEEHDVFDSPRIKNIFSDVANIKVEVDDYDENETQIEVENGYDYLPPSEPMELACEFDPNFTNCNKIILGSKPSASSLIPQQDLLAVYEPASSEPESDEECDDEDESSEDEEPPKIEPSAVVLKNWGKVLENNPCYCKECKILFPTENAMDYHCMTIHSFLVAVNRNKAVKSTAKSSLGHHIVESNDERICSHCNEVFPDENALLKHSYEIFPTKFLPDRSNKRKSLDTVDTKHKGNSDIFEQCSICTCLFMKNKGLMIHARQFHNLNDITPIYVKFPHQCAYCFTGLSSKSIYNVHIKKFHSECFYKNEGDIVQLSKVFKCVHCDLSFPSAYSERIHCATKHSDSSDKSIAKPKSPSKLIDITRPIPKSTLFKCNKCQIHFITCRRAIEHSRHCNQSKGEWKCYDCRRSFQHIDKRVHVKQHELTNKFTVITVNDEMLKRILCRCTNCNVCFDERIFLKLHASGCIATQSVVCKICHYKINKLFLSKHLRNHTQFTTNNLIIIDFVCSSNSDIPQNEKKVIAQSSENNFHLFYCSNCKCYYKQIKSIDNHREGRCSMGPKILCNRCGLQFTIKGMKSHKIDHNKGQIKLRNFTITDVKTKANINPPVPDFHLCNSCNVYFVSPTALKGHTCNAEEHKVCKYCESTFSDLAFKLHMPFHDILLNNPKENIPELIMKYESLKSSWNILYKCKHCEIVTDNYDRVVEHSQEHICAMLNNRMIIQCETCNFKMLIGCYERHEQLHIDNDVTRRSFEILDYDYNLLLTDDWLNIFNTFPEEQVKQILSKSIYSVTRSIRMELITNGASDLTVYLCKVCHTFVEPSTILDHSNSKICPSTLIKYSCAICNFNFLTESLAKEHKNLHETKHVSRESFRILAFVNRENNINNALLMHKKTDEFKFVRCQHCGKLIKKSKYQTHINRHRNDCNNIPTSSIPKKHIQESTSNKSVTADNLQLFQCYTCSICHISGFKKLVKAHICTKYKTHCPKCQMWFRTNSISKHRNLHLKYPFLSKKTIRVIYFNNGVIEDVAPSAEDAIKTITVKTKIPNSDKSQVKSQIFSQHTKAMLRFYQCIQCKSCVHNKSNMMRHSCSPKQYLNKCVKCDLYFFGSQMKNHKLMHQQKLFSKKNIIVLQFKGTNGVLFKKRKSKDTLNKIDSKREKNNRDLLFSRIDYSDTKSTDGVEIEKRATPASIRITVYKCPTCGLKFMPRMSLIHHMEECLGESEVGKACDFCGVEYSKTSYKLHRMSAKCGISPLKTAVHESTLDFRGSDPKVNNNWLHYCSKCNVYFIAYSGLVYHLIRNHKSIEPHKFCDLCGVNFTSRSFNPHINRIHEESQSRFPIINIEQFSDDAMMKFENSSLHKAFTQTKAELVKTKVAKTHKKGTSFLYKCNICDVHFMFISALQSHYNRNKHRQKYSVCSICNLKFTTRTILRHEIMHRQCKQFKVCGINNLHNIRVPNILVDLENASTDDVETASNTVEESFETEKFKKSLQIKHIKNFTSKPYHCSKCDLYYINGKFDPCHEESLMHIDEKVKAKRKVINLYKCYKCPLHFTNMVALDLHHTKDCEAKPATCDKCLLKFTANVLEKHKRIHNLDSHVFKIITPTKMDVDSNISLDDKNSHASKIITPTIMDVDNNISLDDKTVDTINTSDRTHEELKAAGTSENIASEVSVEADRSEADESKAMHENKEVSSNDVPNSTAPVSENKPVLTPDGARTEVKLYKCSECDVYFLDEESCSDHCKDHSILDPTEYIACKICDLQFLCESLGRHMKGHRNKTFNIEYLIVAEYRRKGDALEIETYSAVDSMRLKQVTTTTHSDND